MFTGQPGKPSNKTSKTVM